MAAELGPRVASLHVKDAVVSATPLGTRRGGAGGDGVLDLRPVVAYARAAGVPALVEHLRAPRADEAIAHLAGLAAGAG